jgi:hypothetical protein
MKRVLLIALISLVMIGLFAANGTLLLAKSSPTSIGSSKAAAETMSTAGLLYEAGHYLQAAQAYQQLVDQGFADSSLFYNLGNAHFKQGDYGRAIVNYRRAQELAPRDGDIEANLALARAQVVDEFEAFESSGLLNVAGQSVKSWFSINEVAMAALGAWILLVLLVIVISATKPGSLWRKGLQYSLTATALVLVVGVLALGSILYVDHNQAEGVIVAAEVDVTSGPGTQYVIEFTLHDGAEIQVVEARGSWVRLALPGGELGGWVPAESVEPITG